MKAVVLEQSSFEFRLKMFSPFVAISVHPWTIRSDETEKCINKQMCTLTTGWLRPWWTTFCRPKLPKTLDFEQRSKSNESVTPGSFQLSLFSVFFVSKKWHYSTRKPFSTSFFLARLQSFPWAFAFIIKKKEHVI